jgi:hypothetical protein
MKQSYLTYLLGLVSTGDLLVHKTSFSFTPDY